MRTVFRKEIKYVIPAEGYYRLEKQLDALMHRDRNGIRGTYMVRSQYFDALNDRDLLDNFDGLMEKRKIRIRIYAMDTTWAKLEYKCKSGSDSVKHSIDLTREEAEQMERHQYGFLALRKEPLAQRLYIKMIQNVYRPKTIVAYDRTAFLYGPSDVRVTFDHNLRGTVGGYGLFDESAFLLPLMQPDVGILEVKFNDFLPTPIKSVVSQLDSLALASSKYSMARSINL